MGWEVQTQPYHRSLQHVLQPSVLLDPLPLPRVVVHLQAGAHVNPQGGEGDPPYLEVCLHYHGEVGVVCLGHILLVLAQLDGDNITKMRTGIVSDMQGSSTDNVSI